MPTTPSRPSYLVAPLIALALLGATACGDDAEPVTTTSSCADGGPDWGDGAGRRDGAPTITAPCGDAPDELVVTDLTTGEGPAVEEGDIAVVDYVGANWSNGTVFDASYGRDTFSVTVGAGGVIAGWDEGLLGMQAGGRRQLVIPPELGYGDQANGDIPANETLVFVIDLRSVLRPPADPAPVAGGTVTELVVTDEVTGTGDPVEEGDNVSVHYIGVHGDTGEVFDASWDRGDPIDVQIGAGQVIAGWDQGILGMQVGGRRRLEIPADLAYGADGRPPTIRPGETLVFTVDLVGIA